MKLRLEIRAEASRHIAEAFSWYEAHRPGMGWAFRDELEHAFKLVQDFPNAGPEVYRGLRRVLVDHFPYAVYYSLPAGAVAPSPGESRQPTPYASDAMRRAPGVR